MNKLKETSTEDEISVDVEDAALLRRHKKHKHKKHRRKKPSEDGDTPDDIEKHKLKLKIRWPKDGAGEKAGGVGPTRPSPPKPGERGGASPKSASKRKKGKGRDSGTSSEEERWLDAIESGKLEEVDDELKKIKLKDPKLMTARQRAMLVRKSDKEPGVGGEQLLALPSGLKEKVMTAEAIQKAQLKSQRRKQLADEKREKDKKKTMERLLKKQECKGAKGGQRVRATGRLGPRVLYRSCAEGISVSLPPGVDFPLQHAVSRTPPRAQLCAVEGCGNARKYSCSRTGAPLCSLQCYRRHQLGRG
ncbi:INO80 complex subunit B isoform X2 [Bacillus rossius redtenbacheri]|uniref:INO80 complex subunit B isoform X1 n=1 Tax=Bacillus rossius redtenbacheri TaxID=93214 RepID=UPI002FDD9473